MLYKLHYFFLAAGANALFILLGVYMAEYTEASAAQIGLLYMAMPFVGVIFRPIICSYADRKQAHRQVLIACQLLIALGFAPYVIIPYLGPAFYRARPALTWYLLVAFNIVGDIAFGGAVSIGDSLSKNYATRIGTEFGAYRFWGTVSWIIFGLVTGQLNEAPFLPKYVAAYMTLVLVSVLDALVCFMWPKEYFVMVTTEMVEEERKVHLKQLERSGAKESWLDGQMRSLMPRDRVWAHAKGQLWSLVPLGSLGRARTTPANATNDSAGTSGKNKLAQSIVGRQQTSSPISERAQVRTLFLLMRRDSRIILYLVMFVGAGAMMMPVSFFFMSLSSRCQTQHNCNFSQLAGYLQIAMAVVEPILFVYIETITKAIGRLNILTVAFGLASAKYLFYATIWPAVDPHWSLLSELCNGVLFVVFLTVQVEIGYLFATEVENLIPDLIKRNVISADDETSRERLKLALPATMMSLTSGAYDGLGKGFAALAYGVIIDIYSYETLWIIVTVLALCGVLGLQMAAIFERCFHLEFGPKRPDDLRKQEVDLELRRAVNGNECS